MMKVRCLFSLLVLLIMVSCSTTDEKLRSMIPEDAVGVVRIDVKQVLLKAGMIKKDKDSIVVPDHLKSLIDESDPTVLGDILYNLPQSGIDVNNDCYVFFSPGIFKAVALLPLINEDEARAMVRKITSSKMADIGGVEFASHLDYAYVIDDDVLMIGRYSTPVDANVAAKAAGDILGKTKPSLLANDEVSKNLSDSCDVSAYINVKDFSTILKKNSRFSTIFGNVPAIELITDSGIKAVVAEIDFKMDNKNECAQISTHFIYQKNGQFQKLYDNIISTSTENDSAVLNLIPGELDTYVAMNVDGNKLVHMPQMAKMFDVIEATPLTSGLKHKEILSSIKGTLVFGLSESNVGGYNFVVAAKSTNPDFITNDIINVANSRGQSPYQYAGEYIYDYGSQGIALGQKEDAFYLRCVDYQTGFSAKELTFFLKKMKESSIAIYHMFKIGGNEEGCLNWGLHDKSEGNGFYYSANEQYNVIESVLRCLCWKEPNSSLEESEGDEEYGF